MLFPEQVKFCSVSKIPTPLENCPYLQFEVDSPFCSGCSAALMKNKVPATCKYNNILAGEVPNCLKVLDVAEKRMIAQIQSFMTILVLPGGQFAEKGLTTHFPLDVNKYCDQLFTVIDAKFLTLSYGQECQLQVVPYRKIADVQLVLMALQWLRKNNVLYLNFPNIPVCSTDSTSATATVESDLGDIDLQL